MIILNTNVLSELMKASVSHSVIRWLDQQASSNLFICAITRAEIELGICLLPNGKKKSGLINAAQYMFDEFAGRCLPFDERSAIEYAGLVALRQKSGHPISVEDAQIAAIALANGMQLATRNANDFRFINKLNVINPWDI